jgi:Tol biopolymer transport system component
VSTEAGPILVSGGNNGYDMWAVSANGDGSAFPLANGPQNEIQGTISPDGHWIAYMSDDSGRYEVYVQSFPDATKAPKVTVSVGGRSQPRWNPKGGELFYLRSDGTLMASAVRSASTGGGF